MINVVSKSKSMPEALLVLWVVLFFFCLDYASTALPEIFNSPLLFLYKLMVALVGSSLLLGAITVFSAAASTFLVKVMPPVKRAAEDNTSEQAKEPQTEMEIFLLVRAIIQHENNTALFMLFIGNPDRTPVPYIEPDGTYIHRGKPVDYEEILAVARNAARHLDRNAFDKIVTYMKRYGQ